MESNELKQFRETLEFNKTLMAKCLGVPLQTYIHWENGTRKMNSSARKLLDIISKLDKKSINNLF